MFNRGCQSTMICGGPTIIHHELQVSYPQFYRCYNWLTQRYNRCVGSRLKMHAGKNK